MIYSDRQVSRLVTCVNSFLNPTFAGMQSAATAQSPSKSSSFKLTPEIFELYEINGVPRRMLSGLRIL